MKKWQKRKLRDLLLCLAITIVGLILVVRHALDLCPWIAWVGAVILLIGAVCFSDVRNKDYRKKYSKRG